MRHENKQRGHNPNKDIWLDKLKMSFTVTYNIILNQKKMHVQASTEHFYI